MGKRIYLVLVIAALALVALFVWRLVATEPDHQAGPRTGSATPETEPVTPGSTSSHPQPQRIVCGTVTDVDGGQAIPEAVVRALANDETASSLGLETEGGRSDEEGSYEFTLPPSEDGVSLVCTATGYGTEIRPIPKDQGRVRVDFLLRRGGFVGGVVTDVDTGAPIEGVTVCLLDTRANVLQLMSSQRERPQAVTDAAGVYGIDGVQSGPYRIVVHPKRAGYLFRPEQARHLEVSPGVRSEDVDFELVAGGGVTGIVLDDQGKPIEGAKVRALPSAYMQTVLERVSTFDVSPIDDYIKKTQEDGTFRIPGLDHDVEYRVRAEAKGYAWAASEPFMTNRAAPTQELRLILTRGSTISGRVVYDDGSPAPDKRLILVMAAPVDSLSMTLGPRFDKASSEGSFEFKHVTAGTYALYAKDTSAHQSVEVDGVSDATGIELSLGSEEELGTEVIAGTVVDSTGAPVADVRVQARMGPIPMTRTTTAPDGAFTLEKLKEGRYDVIATCDTGRAKETGVATGTTVTLTLDAPGRVAGMVVDDEGEPVGSCGVELCLANEPSASETLEDMFREMFDGAVGKTATDAFGVFEFEEVWPGKYAVEATSGERGKGKSPSFQVVEGQDVLDLQIVLSAGVEITGIVVNKRGQPVAGALVQLVEAGESDQIRQLVSQVMVPGMRATSGTAVTDESGQFVLDAVMPGSYDMTVTHRAYAQKMVRGVSVGELDLPQQRVVLADPSNAKGRFLVKGEPKAGAMVVLFGPTGLHIATTDAQGLFQVSGLGGGAYITKAFDPAQLTSGDLSAIDLSIDVVDVVDGEDVDLEIGASGGTPVGGTVRGVGSDALTWIVFRDPDAPLPSSVDIANVSGWADALRAIGGQSFVGPDGSFDAGEIEPGVYVAEVYSIDFTQGIPQLNDLMNLADTPLVSQQVEVGSEPVALDLTIGETNAPAE